MGVLGQRAKSPKKSDGILNLMTLPSMGVVLHSCSSPGGRGGVKSRVSGLGTYSPLSHWDDCMDAGGGVTPGAVTERVRALLLTQRY